VESPLFADKSLVAQHKWVKQLLKDEMKDLHAITLHTSVPRSP